MIMRLEGKIVLVTGGGSGIGRGIVERFAHEGASTAVLDVNDAGAQQVADAARRMGADAIALHADVSHSEQVQAAMRAVADRWGRLDVLVNSAGIFWAQRGDTLVTEMDEAVWDHVLAVNLKGVFLCCKFGIPLMKQRGAIVNISSIGGLLGRDTAQAYVASKGGVTALTRTLAVQYAPRHIRANAILPGRVDTPLVQEDYATADERAAFATAHPAGRFGRPEDIAGLALYLASDEAEWVTGSAYVIDGGFMVV
jgi:NAD(P)-dependent dehydrogenase (short-subunit alcohol dehydrogenase family)